MPSSADLHVTPNAASRPIVYYDGSCPLCAAEIDGYRKCRGAAGIDWIDVGGNPRLKEDTVAPGLTRKDVQRRFHMRRADGTIVSGAAAFAELWSSLPGLSWVGKIARRRPVVDMLELGYRAFLPVRPFLQNLARRRSARRQP